MIYRLLGIGSLWVTLWACTGVYTPPGNTTPNKTAELCNKMQGSYSNQVCQLKNGDSFSDEQVNGCLGSQGSPAYLQTTCENGSFKDSDCLDGTYTCSGGAGVAHSIVHCICPTGTCWNDTSHACEKATS